MVSRPRRKLDDIIDFLTYTSLPLLLIWRAGLFPEGMEAWLAWLSVWGHSRPRKCGCCAKGVFL